MVAPSDFKKIKAKVGKRAPVKANVTDTSFKAVGLHISKQVGITELNVSAQSATTTRRGLTLHHLLSQLKHPTISVRLAAVKGLKSLLSVSPLINLHLQSYLSDIVISLAPASCIDDDPTVRKASSQILQDVFLQSPAPLLLPFVPYLFALVATSLNSLDIQQRYDGAVMVRWLFETIKLSSESSFDVINNAIVQLIPPLTRLLAVAPIRVSVNAVGESAFQSNKDDSLTAVMPVGTMKKSKRCKKRKRPPQQPPEVNVSENEKKDASVNSSLDSSNPKYAVLMAIYALFRAAKVLLSPNSSTNFQGVDETTSLAPDVKFPSGQLRSSMLFFQNECSHQSMQLSCIRNPITCLSKFPSWSQLAISSLEEDGDGPYSEINRYRSQENPNIRLGYPALTSMEVLDLLCKIRDYLFESSQSKESQQFLFCISTVRLALECNAIVLYPNCVVSSSSISVEDEARRVQKLCSQIGSCIVESFALFDRYSNNTAELLLTLLCLATTLQQWVQQPRYATPVTYLKQTKLDKKDSDIHHWTQFVASHIQNLLKDDEGVLENRCCASDLDFPLSDNEKDESLTPQLETFIISQPMLPVLAQLLLRNDLQPYYGLKDPLIGLFCSVFFNENRPLPDSLTRSDVGRHAAVLGCLLIADNKYCLDCTTHESKPSFVVNVLLRLPFFLSQWQGDYLKETSICVFTLKSVVCRLKSGEASNCKFKSDFLANLWRGIHLLLRLPKLLNVCSIFEMYPESLQRRLICLISMSGSPPASTIKSLADICARCVVKSVVPNQVCVSMMLSSFIVQCIHNVRKTISMHSYISFLIDAAGILKLDSASKSQSDIVTISYDLDKQLQSISKCLVSCGTAKVLPMLGPLLSALMNFDRGNPAFVDPICMVKARASLCLLAVFSLDLKGANDAKMSISYFVSRELLESLVRCIADILSIGVHFLFESADDAAFRYFMIPIFILFATENNLMARVFGLVVDNLLDLDDSRRDRILDVWSDLFKEPQIQSMLVLDNRTILDHVHRIPPGTASKTPNPIVSRMIAELEFVGMTNIRNSCLSE